MTQNGTTTICIVQDKHDAAMYIVLVLRCIQGIVIFICMLVPYSILCSLIRHITARSRELVPVQRLHVGRLEQALLVPAREVDADRVEE